MEKVQIQHILVSVELRSFWGKLQHLLLYSVRTRPIFDIKYGKLNNVPCGHKNYNFQYKYTAPPIIEFDNSKNNQSDKPQKNN